MGNKWSIAERPGVYERCRQLEAIAQKIFQSPKAWVNGFIRLVSLEGTWYYHRGTDIFVPVEQEYLEQTFSADGKPEKGVIRLKAGNMDWDYLDDLEAQQILPNLAELNLPKISGKHNVGEICRTATIFLKGGKVYDGRCKGIRFLQNDEKATVLQICHSENDYSGKVHKEQKNDSWRYDIYLWAKTGVVPAVLCNIKECWNTIQFLRDNFNDIDFTDFVLPEGKAEGGTEPEAAREEAPAAGKEPEAAEAGSPVEPDSREEPKAAEKLAEESEAAELQEELQPTESEVSVETDAREEPKAAETREEPQLTGQETLAEIEAQQEPKPESEEPIAEPEEAAAEPEVRDESKPLAEEEQSAEPVSREEPQPADSVNRAGEESQEEPKPEPEEAAAEPEVRDESKPLVEEEQSAGPKAQEEPRPVGSEYLAEAESQEGSKSEPEETTAEPEVHEESKPLAEEEQSSEPVSQEEPQPVGSEQLAETESQEEPKPEPEEAAAEPEVDEESKPLVEEEQSSEPVSQEEPQPVGSEYLAEAESQEEPKPEPEEAAAEPEERDESKPLAEEEQSVEPEAQEEPQTTEPETFAEPEFREEPQSAGSEHLAEAESQEEPKPEPEEATTEPEEREESKPLAEEGQSAEPEAQEEPKTAWEEPTVEAESQPQPEIPESLEPKPESLEATEEAAQEEAEPTVATQEKAESGNPSAPESTEERSASDLEEAAEKQDGQESEKQTEQIGRVEKMGIVRGQDEIQQLLDCDKNRCRLEPYDRDILYDIIRGHWELFQEGETYCDDSEQELIPRDPRLDIREGVIGIDFGTKSTVVVRQDATNRIVPIRIGTGNLSSEVKEEDFENPSIIEFTNVEKFLEDYQKEAGRPHTSCNDVFVSYDAYEDFRNCKPEDFYAYFGELKQWANREKGNVVVKDKQKVEYTMGAKMNEAPFVINPIELYAYYIGLAINNMRNGIYLKYLMTFPVGYAKEIRDFIAESFYEGIKKSLPSSVINDKECMERFKVELGISEPAAYAVTALEQSNLEPEDETQRRMYGIFDFGGGTTDFDFGICRGATEEEYEDEAYDYVLECFGADSDVTLGGENILELIAYQVYQRNLDVFREKKITFTLPQGEKGFAGSETLLINSQIARRNMAILKEELRPLWHQEQGWRKKYQLEGDSQNEVDKEGMIVSLYNMDGEPVPQCVLEFSSQELVELLKNRIQKGIDSFFQCMIKVFLDREDITAEDDTIYIFLAGNASKSVFVKELFQRKIEEYYSKSKKTSEGMGNVSFVLIDPLTGGNESGEGYVPNAKTGVAYGLLKSRDGSSIKIVKNHETDALQQSRFHYYLGRDRRHYFDCRFSPAEIAYKKWVPFQKASKSVVRIYYTNNPMADSKMEQLPIADVPYKEISIDVTEGASLFIRTVEPDVVEYAVAKDAEDISENEIRKCLFD